MAVTIKDIALRCGISVSTVSKVFNNYADVSDSMRRQVIVAAQELDYMPNALARALKTNRSYNLGVLFAGDTNDGLTPPVYSGVFNAFKAEAVQRGYDITFVDHNIGDRGMSYLEHCRYRNMDGVFLICADFYSAEVAELVNSNIPCVTFDHMFNNRPSVNSDNLNGIRMLVDRAVALGHKNIAYIHGQRNSSVTENRIMSFYRAMEAHGLKLPFGYVTESRYNDFESVFRRLSALLERQDRPTCILLPDDSSYFGALDVIRKQHLRVPEDISLAGYDGISLIQTIQPKLTTVRQDSKAIGREAATRLIERIDHPKTAIAESMLIPVTLVEGESLAAAPEATHPY